MLILFSRNLQSSYPSPLPVSRYNIHSSNHLRDYKLLYCTPQGPAKLPVLLNAGLVSGTYDKPEKSPLGQELETPAPLPWTPACETTHPS
jgi:hypothetical protein